MHLTLTLNGKLACFSSLLLLLLHVVGTPKFICTLLYPICTFYLYLIFYLKHIDFQ